MNKCIFTGRLTAEPQLKQTSQGTAVCRFTLAVNRAYKKNEESEADFIAVVAWREKAEFAARYLHKGNKIILEANARTRRYEKNGQTHFVTEFYADNIEFAEAALPNKNKSKQDSNFFDPNEFEPFEEDNLPWDN